MNREDIFEFIYVDQNEYCNTVTETEEFKRILNERGLIRSGRSDRGGYGMVVHMDEPQGTVLKCSSFLHSDLFTMDQGQLYIKPDVATGDTLDNFLKEGYIFGLMQDVDEFPKLHASKRVKNPFVIVFRHNSRIVDIVLCILMKRYVSINEYFKNGVTERGVLKMAADVLKCLEVAHQTKVPIEGSLDSIIHRDIKPANIMYDPEKNCFVLLDWGAGKIFEAVTYPVGEYNEPLLRGSQGFFDPCRLNVRGNNENYIPIDLYSVAAVMFFMMHRAGYAATGLSGQYCDEYRNSVMKKIEKFNLYVISFNDDNYRSTGASSEFCRIIKNALEHGVGGYENAYSMLCDVQRLLGENSMPHRTDSKNTKENNDSEKGAEKKTKHLHETGDKPKGKGHPIAAILCIVLLIVTNIMYNAHVHMKEHAMGAEVGFVCLIGIILSGMGAVACMYISWVYGYGRGRRLCRLFLSVLLAVYLVFSVALPAAETVEPDLQFGRLKSCAVKFDGVDGGTVRVLESGTKRYIDLRDMINISRFELVGEEGRVAQEWRIRDSLAVKEFYPDNDFFNAVLDNKWHFGEGVKVDLVKSYNADFIYDANWSLKPLEGVCLKTVNGEERAYVLDEAVLYSHMATDRIVIDGLVYDLKNHDIYAESKR